MKKTLAWLILAALGLSGLIVWLGGQGRSVTTQDAPWHVEVQSASVSRIFGFDLGRSSLSEVRARLGTAGELALMVDRPGDPATAAALEVFVDPFEAGPVSGKLVLGFAIDAAQVADIVAQGRAAIQPSGARKFRLDAAQQERLAAARLASATFIPAARLTSDLVLQRFGAPAQRIGTQATVEHWLYPRTGLCITLDPKGKDLLQYVPTEHFARLSAPLAQTGSESRLP